MKKIFDYIGLGFMAIYASLPFIPVYHYYSDTKLYDPDVGEYVPTVIHEHFNAFANFPGFVGPVFATILLVAFYSLLALTVFFFIKDFKNEKRRKWFFFVGTSLLIAALMICMDAPRGF